MNKGYGGEIMRSTLIKQLEGYLGPYHDAANPRMVNVDQMQNLVYGKDVDINYGPFYLALTRALFYNLYSWWQVLN